MKKINILKNNLEFNRIIKKGKKYKNAFYNVFVVNKQKENYRCGISIPKKTGNAVLRNKIKRQIKDIIQKENIINNEYDIIIIVKKEIINIDYNSMKDSLKNIFNIINKENNNE